MARLAWLDKLFGDDAQLRSRWLRLEQIKMKKHPLEEPNTEKKAAPTPSLDDSEDVKKPKAAAKIVVAKETRFGNCDLGADATAGERWTCGMPERVQSN